MTRLTYVIPTLSVGGTEWQLIHLLQGLIKDHDVAVICTRHGGALSADAKRLGAYVREIGLRSGWDFRQKARIAHILRGFKPDIVHSFMFGFDLYANQAARDVGVPVVISSRRQLATWRKARHIWMQKKANSLVDCIVCNSRAVADFAIEQEGADPSLFRVIPNGIRADQFVSDTDVQYLKRRYDIPEEARVIGIVANFSPVKDYPLFVDMAGDLLKRRSDLHFLMVGAGPAANSIEHRIAAQGLESHFTRVTTISERADLYALMDVSVLCSKVEGFPNALMEAMSAGTPVVAANVGGVPELITSGQNGWLVDLRNPADFADAVQWVLDHPEEARAMAANGFQHIRATLPMEKMVMRYRSLYSELLRNKLQENTAPTRPAGLAATGDGGDGAGRPR